MTVRRDIGGLIPIGVALLIAAAAIAAVWTLRASSQEGEHLAGRLAALNLLHAQFAELREKESRLSSKIRPGGDGRGAVGIVEEIFQSLGLTDKLVGIKPGERDSLPGGEQRQTVRFEVQRIDLNALVNVLYSIDKYPAALQVVDLHVKTDFERPNLLNLDFGIALVSGGA